MRSQPRNFDTSIMNAQIQETLKLKKCIMEFSQRLVNVQERLMQGENRICSQKVRRFSCDISRDPEFNPFSTGFQRNFRKVEEAGRQVFCPSQIFQNGFPITSSQLLQYFKEFLSPYEQGEALEYKKIYYFGQSAEKIKSFSTKSNFSYDDERGDYKIIKHDHFSYRFEILEPLGKGAFGQVVKVFDHKTKEPLALKVIKNKSRFAEQAQTEVQILKILEESDKNNENFIVRTRKSFIFRNHFCIVFELLGPSLYSVLRNQEFQGLDERIIRRIAFQVLQALENLARQGVIHCDLKPENILTLTNSKNSVKVIDLGSACFKNKKVFNYIQSRFYRAPEVVLAVDYNQAIDIWSFGCILTELFTGRPLFPAEDEVELVGLMVSALGLPPFDLIKDSKRLSMFFHSNMQPRGRTRSRFAFKLVDVLQGASHGFIDLVQRCLAWKPESRITPLEAMKHEFFSYCKTEQVVKTEIRCQPTISPLYSFNRSSALTEKHKVKSFVF